MVKEFYSYVHRTRCLQALKAESSLKHYHLVMLMCSTLCLSLENSSEESEQCWLRGEPTSLLKGEKICHCTAAGKEENHASPLKKLRNLTKTNFQRQIRAVIASSSSSFFSGALGIPPFKKSHVKANSHELPFPNSLTFTYLKDCSHRAVSSRSTQSPKGLGTECFYILPETYKFVFCSTKKTFRKPTLKYFTDKSDLKLI